jgi:ABC-type sugar transport system substrate-binding protein
MANKKMFPIPLTDSNPFEVAIIKGMEQAAGIVGFTLTAWQTELSPDQWTQGITGR